MPSPRSRAPGSRSTHNHRLPSGTTWAEWPSPAGYSRLPPRKHRPGRQGSSSLFCRTTKTTGWPAAPPPVSRQPYIPPSPGWPDEEAASSRSPLPPAGCRPFPAAQLCQTHARPQGRACAQAIERPCHAGFRQDAQDDARPFFPEAQGQEPGQEHHIADDSALPPAAQRPEAVHAIAIGPGPQQNCHRQ